MSKQLCMLCSVSMRDQTTKCPNSYACFVLCLWETRLQSVQTASLALFCVCERPKCPNRSPRFSLYPWATRLQIVHTGNHAVICVCEKPDSEKSTRVIMPCSVSVKKQTSNYALLCVYEKPDSQMSKHVNSYMCALFCVFGKPEFPQQSCHRVFCHMSMLCLWEAKLKSLNEQHSTMLWELAMLRITEEPHWSLREVQLQIGNHAIPCFF